MSKRRSCPFCGHDHSMVWHIGHLIKPWFVECTRCLATGPSADTEERAIELWNRRAEE